MANKEQSVPLLSNTDDHASIDSDSATLIYTPSISDDLEALPEYNDDPHQPPSATDPIKKDYLPKDSPNVYVFDIDRSHESDKCSRRRCFGRSRRCHAAEPQTRKQRIRRRVFIFLKITFLLGLISFFVARKCMHSKWAQNHPSVMFECPINEHNEHYTPESTNREIIRETGSRSIWGRYPLYDLLELRTTSGSIAINVDPQPADPENPNKPARLVLETESGTVAVRFSHPHLDRFLARDAEDAGLTIGDYLDQARNCAEAQKRRNGGYYEHENPAVEAAQYRPYEIEIHTKTGTVSAQLIFSSSAVIESESGTISATLLPIVSSEGVSDPTLVTRTGSGSQSLVLGNAYVVGTSEEGDGYSMITASGHASSSHSSDSGSIYVKYPGSWAGTVEAEAHGGTICLDGEGLEVSKDGQGHASGVRYPDEDDEKPEWWGSRGDMDVSLEARGSGSINFFVSHTHSA
ncbi:hypothetical protein BGW36DRAFT_430544 [Talaromyces proteolyticus]|uniref:Uncharacterized protein n=1 Tax=Talaromyces proteolyticus TaxID=1131652 RepID=A0AAD4KI60_9EURO|nr:uncharacterized protein BGW36DRAFT_430544 [Talaromyces proteolyticus]KAH8692798.1 hypothetical protein BGW36DRAFT_430544 [Talaromyces proteolyticus]